MIYVFSNIFDFYFYFNSFNNSLQIFAIEFSFKLRTQLKGNIFIDNQRFPVRIIQRFENRNVCKSSSGVLQASKRKTMFISTEVFIGSSPRY